MIKIFNKVELPGQSCDDYCRDSDYCKRNKECAYHSLAPIPNSQNMIDKKELEQFGKVEVCEEINNTFHAKITDGFSIKASNVFGPVELISSVVGHKYPFIEKLVTDNNLFEIILKPKSQLLCVK